MQSEFQLEYDSLNPEFYIQKTSENLALTFDPIQASGDSESPFKSISDSTIEVDKKTIYVCKPSPYFFDSLEKYHQYLLNVKELLDRNFDVRFIYQDKSGDYKVAQINKYTFLIEDKNDTMQFLEEYLFYQDPIDIKKARNGLGIVHDSSIFLEDFEIHESRKTIKYPPVKGIGNLEENREKNTQEDNAESSDYIIYLKQIFDNKYNNDGGQYDQYFNVFLIKYLEQNFNSKFNESADGLDKFKTIIDYVFNCLENNDEKFFPIDELKNLINKLNESNELQKSTPHQDYLNQKISQNNPLQKRPEQSSIINIKKEYAIKFITFTQSEYEYKLNKEFSSFRLEARKKPELNKLNIVSAPPLHEKEGFKGFVETYKEFKTSKFDDQQLLVRSTIEFQKDQLVAISNSHRNALQDKIIGYSIDSDETPKPQITFFQDPKTGLLYVKSDKECKVNILMKNTYLTRDERQIATINLLKQEDPSDKIVKQYNISTIRISFERDSNNLIYISKQAFETIEETKKNIITVGNVSSTASDSKGSNVIQKYYAGEILSRNPSQKKPFVTRDVNFILQPTDNTQSDWLIEEDSEKQIIDLSSSKKDSGEFLNFVSKDFDSSEAKTTAHFKSSMQAGNLIKLHSIASDDKILAFTVKTSDLSSEIANSNINFFKDKDGYYYAQSDQDCVLEYITQGTELQRHDVQDFAITQQTALDVENNFTKALKILNDFSSNENFNSSVEDKDIKLPTLQDHKTDKYLDELFENPASCRHRVMAVAHKFQKEGLKNGEDFRIIGTKGDHTEIELKISDDNWVIIDLGGSNSQTIEAEEEALRPAKFSQIQSKILQTPAMQNPTTLSNIAIPVISNTASKSTTTILSISGEGCLENVLKCFGLKSEQPTDPLPTQPTDPLPDQLKMITPQNETRQVSAPSQSPKPRVELSESLIENFDVLTKLTKIESLATQTSPQGNEANSIQSIADDIISSSSANNSIYLKSSSSSGQEALKCHLLATHRNNCTKSDISTLEFNQEVAKTHYLVSSSKDLAIAKEVLFDKSQTANDNLEITANTRFASFLQSARNEPQKSHLLIIDWNEFSDKMKVASNSMFDKSDRRIGDEKIPDNVKIICLDNSKQSNQDPSITSRFNQAFSIEVEDSKIKTATQEISPISTQKLSATSIPTKNINHDFDFAGLPDWKSALMGLVELQGDKILWNKSQFIEKLQNISSSNPHEAHHFTFSNINKENQQQLTSFLEQSRVLGYIEFQGKQIIFPQNFTFEFKEKEFDFAKVILGFQGDTTSSIQISQQPIISPQNPQTITSLSADLVYAQIDQQKSSSRDLPKLRIATNCQFHDLANFTEDQSKKIYSVNNFSFDKLLTSPTIDDQGNFYQEEGILEKNRGQKLQLFISGNLSNQQYYLLLSKAQDLDIKLDLLLAPEVKLPAEIIVDEAKSLELKSEFSTKPSPFEPRIIVSNDIAKSSTILMNELQKSCGDKKIFAINIEDLMVSDLFPSFDTKIKESPEDATKYKFQLSKLTSEIDDKLANGDKIIIKGRFNDKLLTMLHQHLLATEKSYENLYFVMEEKEQSVFEEKASIYKKLSFLPSSQYRLESSKLKSKNKLEIITLPYFQETDNGAGVFQGSAQSQVDYSIHLTREKIENGDIFVEAISSTLDVSNLSDEQIEKNSSDFISARKQILTKLFEHSALVKIVGESGVGKSSLLREFAKTADDSTSPVIKTYNELGNLESWAKDKEGDNLKILVIDEYNVDTKMDYTMFRDFNQQQDSTKPREIFYQGKFYQLTDKHKVVFMGNPTTYGNRKEGKLFEDSKVPTLELKDFPPEYIYQEILQKPILEPMISDSSKLTEEIKKSPKLVEEFKKICDEEIKKYKAQNSGGVAKNKTELTVRELQEQVLLKLSKYIDKAINSQSTSQAPISTADFVETSSTKDNIEAIRNALMIRKQQKQGLLSQSIIGTSGLIFEGDSGIGKSVMIEAVLKSQNITRLASQDVLMKLPILNNSTDQSSQHYYYKIPANISAQEIEQQLIEASKRGVIVVFDEINTRLNEGLEKTINALLTGSHPSSKESDDQPKAGFMIIGSINSAIHAGRSAMSPAIIHRSTYINGKELKDYSSQDFKIIMQNWAEHLTDKNDEGKKNKDETQILQFKTTNPEQFEQLIGNLAETFHKMLNPQTLQSHSFQNYNKISEISAESLNIRNLKSTFLKSLSQEIEIVKSSQPEKEKQ